MAFEIKWQEHKRTHSRVIKLFTQVEHFCSSSHFVPATAPDLCQSQFKAKGAVPLTTYNYAADFFTSGCCGQKEITCFSKMTGHIRGVSYCWLLSKIYSPASGCLCNRKCWSLAEYSGEILAIFCTFHVGIYCWPLSEIGQCYNGFFVCLSAPILIFLIKPSGNVWPWFKLPWEWAVGT